MLWSGNTEHWVVSVQFQRMLIEPVVFLEGILFRLMSKGGSYALA